MKNEKGFTLLVLVFTVVIMIILASISIGEYKETDIVEKAEGLTQMVNSTYENQQLQQDEMIRDIM